MIYSCSCNEIWNNFFLFLLVRFGEQNDRYSAHAISHMLREVR